MEKKHLTEVAIDLNEVCDAESFHSVFQAKLGFPEFYGHNFDAWIDCMTRVDRPEDGMSEIHAPEGGLLVLALFSVKAFRVRCPELFTELIDCVALVNYRRMEMGEHPVLSVSYCD
jgi:hypothetical protein